MTEPYRIVATPGIPGLDRYAEGSEISAGRVTEIRTVEGDLILLGYVPSTVVVRAIAALPVLTAVLKRMAQDPLYTGYYQKDIHAALDLIQPRTPT
jgi:hypothetical protein